MQMKRRTELFRQVVENKYQIYNSLFMNLPYDKMTNIGMLLPFLYQESKNGYEKGDSPMEVMQNFFESHTDIETEEEKVDLLFRIVQYVERQVVLFDSIEDSAFSTLHSKNDPGTVRNLYEIASNNGKLDELKEKLKTFVVKIVFTAHPTQFYPNSVQTIMRDLHDAIQKDSITKIDSLLQQLGMTPFVNKEKPTPFDEAENIIYYLRNVYYDTLGELYHDIKKIIGTDELNDELFHLGFWPGGDRDGNPYVNAEMTRKVATSLRMSVLECYHEHLKRLKRRLTFPKVSRQIDAITKRVYDNIYQNRQDLTAEEFKIAVLEIRDTLINENNGLFVDEIEDLLGRIDLFGVYFASLDIRENERVHDQVIEEIFRKEFDKDYNALSDDEKLDYLLNKRLSVNPGDYAEGGDIVQETLKNVYQLKELQRINGEPSVNRYIISEAISVFDILHVYALFKYCGYADDEINFDIIPLFETIEGFTEARKTMDFLYNHPVYEKHLKRRNNKQFIMLGFSDGTKDAGTIRANWNIYTTKETLTEVSEENDIKVVFFDGRGGPPARGGGKTHQFYAARGAGIANNQIELTIQGQTITSVYGTKDQATYNFEQMLSAGMLNEVNPTEHDLALKDWERDLFNELADISYKKYKDLKDHELFVPYLEDVSTLQYYGQTNIGSRPSSRNEGELVFEDLRAIPFVSSWSLLKQNVPGYFGVGTALKNMKDEGRLGDVKKLYKTSKFFKTLMQNSMMSMSKTYFPLTQYLQGDDKFGEFWQILYDEFQLTHELILEVADSSILMEEEPLSKESIIMREKIVLPLLTIQQYALMKIKGDSDYQGTYEKMVTRALFGNINASRNSA